MKESLFEYYLSILASGNVLVSLLLIIIISVIEKIMLIKQFFAFLSQKYLYILYKNIHVKLKFNMLHVIIEFSQRHFF